MKNTVLKYWKNEIVRNIFLAFLAVIFILILSSVFLSGITRHGNSSPLPYFVGKTIDSVLFIAKKHNLRIEIIDSVDYNDQPRGVVYKQDPDSGEHVKKNRKVFLTINSLTQKKELVPNVAGLSLRQATSVLRAKNFRVGRLTYDSRDFATNNVLQQYYKGSRIESGLILSVGEYIDLKLGLDSEENTSIKVPEVVRLSRFKAEDVLIDNSLNYQWVFDRNIRTLPDSLNAVVYKQEPEAGFKSHYGNEVKIWLKRGKK